MKLLKQEVGQLALHVLTQGNAYAQSLTELPSTNVRICGRKRAGRRVRKKQSVMSKRTTRDVLEAVRGGRVFR